MSDGRLFSRSQLMPADELQALAITFSEIPELLRLASTSKDNLESLQELLSSKFENMAAKVGKSLVEIQNHGHLHASAKSILSTGLVLLSKISYRYIGILKNQDIVNHIYSANLLFSFNNPPLNPALNALLQNKTNAAILTENYDKVYLFNFGKAPTAGININISAEDKEKLNSQYYDEENSLFIMDNEELKPQLNDEDDIQSIPNQENDLVFLNKFSRSLSEKLNNQKELSLPKKYSELLKITLGTIICTIIEDMNKWDENNWKTNLFCQDLAKAFKSTYGNEDTLKQIMHVGNDIFTRKLPFDFSILEHKAIQINDDIDLPKLTDLKLLYDSLPKLKESKQDILTNTPKGA